MRHFEEGRSYKQQKIDRDAVHDMEEQHVSEKARKQFDHRPYTSYGVADCLKKWGIDVKGDVASGQEGAE